MAYNHITIYNGYPYSTVKTAGIPREVPAVFGSPAKLFDQMGILYDANLIAWNDNNRPLPFNADQKNIVIEILNAGDLITRGANYIKVEMAGGNTFYYFITRLTEIQTEEGLNAVGTPDRRVYDIEIKMDVWYTYIFSKPVAIDNKLKLRVERTTHPAVLLDNKAVGQNDLKCYSNSEKSPQIVYPRLYNSGQPLSGNVYVIGLFINTTRGGSFTAFIPQFANYETEWSSRRNLGGMIPTVTKIGDKEEFERIISRVQLYSEFEYKNAKISAGSAIIENGDIIQLAKAFYIPVEFITTTNYYKTNILTSPNDEGLILINFDLSSTMQGSLQDATQNLSLKILAEDLHEDNNEIAGARFCGAQVGTLHSQLPALIKYEAVGEMTINSKVKFFPAVNTIYFTVKLNITSTSFSIFMYCDGNAKEITNDFLLPAYRNNILENQYREQQLALQRVSAGIQLATAGVTTVASIASGNVLGAVYGVAQIGTATTGLLANEAANNDPSLRKNILGAGAVAENGCLNFNYGGICCIVPYINTDSIIDQFTQYGGLVNSVAEFDLSLFVRPRANDTITYKDYVQGGIISHSNRYIPAEAWEEINNDLRDGVYFIQ